MHTFVPTIKFRLAMALGVPALLTLGIGVAATAALRDSRSFSGLPANALLWLLPVATCVTVAILAFGFVHLHAIVVDGLGRQSRSFQYLSQTLDLSRRSAARRMDEFGRGAVWFDRFMNRVEETVLTVQAATDSVSTATQQIAAGNMDLSARTEEQAASLEETAASMVELTETVRHNTDNARQANSLASRASGMADNGHDAVQAMMHTIEQINQGSAKISEITGLIEGIAFQTNILALNAAVEAARAGDHGRGFAVVASEVRNLAQRSSTAAKEIRALIGSSVAMVREGSSQATHVGSTVEQVKTAIGQVSAIVAEIASASEEQSRGIEQVAAAVTQMDQVTQQNAALVEQAAAAAQSLEEQVTRVRGTLSEFKVRATGTAKLSA